MIESFIVAVAMETPQPKRTKTLPTLVCVMAHDEGADFSSSDDSGDDDGAPADDLVVDDDLIVLVAEDLIGDWKSPLVPFVMFPKGTMLRLFSM